MQESTNPKQISGAMRKDQGPAPVNSNSTLCEFVNPIGGTT